jgi:hypothetical protein
MSITRMHVLRQLDRAEPGEASNARGSAHLSGDEQQIEDVDCALP